MKQLPSSRIDGDQSAVTGSAKSGLGASLSQPASAVKVKATEVNTRKGRPGGRGCCQFSPFESARPESYNEGKSALGCFMDLRTTALLILSFVLGTTVLVSGQSSDPVQTKQQSLKGSPTSQAPDEQQPAAALDPNAPRIGKQTRLEIIRDFETQMVYARAAFPMGAKG